MTLRLEGGCSIQLSYRRNTHCFFVVEYYRQANGCVNRVVQKSPINNITLIELKINILHIDYDFINKPVFANQSRKTLNMTENSQVGTIGIIRRSFSLFALTNTGLRIHQLTLASLLATVPIITIIIGILGFTPALQTLQSSLFLFLETHLVPGSSAIVTPYLIAFSEQAKKLPIAGFIMLIATALVLLNSFEAAVQAIWQIEKRRNLKDRLLIYWAILTLGPILLGTSLSIYGKVLSLQWQGLEIGGGLNSVLDIGNFILYLALLFILNYLSPNTQVKIKHAFISSLVGAFGIMFINFLFTSFTHFFSNYQIVYGAFAAIPTLIIWLQLIWGIMLVSVCLCSVLHTTRP